MSEHPGTSTANPSASPYLVRILVLELAFKDDYPSPYASRTLCAASLSIVLTAIKVSLLTLSICKRQQE